MKVGSENGPSGRRRARSRADLHAFELKIAEELLDEQRLCAEQVRLLSSGEFGVEGVTSMSQSCPVRDGPGS